MALDEALPRADPSPSQTVVSFDIDGTMEFGEPPGPIPARLVAGLIAEGYVVGCASDRGRSSQASLWQSYGIELSFTGGKHHLSEVRELFGAERYVHVGDTHVDQHYAKLADFEFVSIPDLVLATPVATTSPDDETRDAALRDSILRP